MGRSTLKAPTALTRVGASSWSGRQVLPSLAEGIIWWRTLEDLDLLK